MKRRGLLIALICLMVCAIFGASASAEACQHKWAEQQIAKATCTQAAQYAEVCTECGEQNGEAWSEGDPLPHTEETIPKVDATCITKGKTEGKKCSVCGTILVPQQETALGAHDFADKEIAPATCLKAAQYAEVCTVCDAQNGEAWSEGEPLPHTPVVIPAVSATCTSTGWKEGSKCSVCETILVAPVEVAMKSHSYTDTKIADATCTQAAQYAEICAECGAQNGEAWGDGEPLPHTPVTVAQQEPTCSQAGHKAGVQCSVCKTVIEGMEAIEKLPHQFKSTVVKPTTTRRGYTKHVCQVCGYKYNDNYTAKLKGSSSKEPAATPAADMNQYGSIVTDEAGNFKDYVAKAEAGVMTIVAQPDASGAVETRKLHLTADLINTWKAEDIQEVRFVLDDATLTLPLALLESEDLALVANDLGVSTDGAEYLLTLAPADAPEGYEAVSDAYAAGISISAGVEAFDITQLVPGMTLSIMADEGADGCSAMYGTELVEAIYDGASWTVDVTGSGAYVVVKAN